MLLWNQHILICICRSIKGFQRQISLLGNVNHYKWNLLRLNWFTYFYFSAIINWATSDTLPIPAHNVSRAESWIHSDASCVIWQRSGALVTPHLIKRNWLWRSSCRPSSPLCLSAWHKTTVLTLPLLRTHRAVRTGPVKWNIGIVSLLL